MNKTSSYEMGAASAFRRAGLSSFQSIEAAHELGRMEKGANLIDAIGENAGWLLPLLTTVGGTTLGYYSGRYGSSQKGMLGNMLDFSVGGLRKLVRKSRAPMYNLKDYLHSASEG